MTLGHARCLFSSALVRLLYEHMPADLAYAFDEVTDHVTTKDPTTDHMKGSLHEIGLAADVLLYRNGIYLTRTEDYQVLGEQWEQLGHALGLDLAWGGRFAKPDGNHFSLRWAGKA